MWQGDYVVDADVFGRLDRLAGLSHVISQEDIEQSLAEAGVIQRRKCPLSGSVLMWIVLAMGVFTDVPIREVFRLSQFYVRGKKLPSRSALCRGRKRLGPNAIRRLFFRVVGCLATQDSPGCFYKGYHLVAIISEPTGPL